MIDTGAARCPARSLLLQFESASRWQHWLGLLVVMSPAVVCALQKPLSNDELFTFEVSRLDSVAAIWRALAAGADNHPPLDYLLRHVSMSVFGQGELAFRLPSLVALFAALAFMLDFLARRGSVVLGWIAVLIALATPLFEYGYEARAYALLTAFAAAALAAWQRASDGSRRAALLLALSCAAMLWSHYYGILVFVPLAIGEAVRTWRSRRIEVAVWAALAAGAAALLPLLPLIAASRRIGTVFWTKVGVLQSLSIYQALTDRLPIIAVVIVAVFLLTHRPVMDKRPDRLPLHEIVAIIGYVALPVFAYILARFTGALAPRYVLATVLGVAIGFACAAWEIVGSDARLALALVGLLALNGFGGGLALAWKQRRLHDERQQDEMPRIAATLSDPIVLTDNDLLMQFWHYLPAPVASRLVYLADDRAALEMYGWDTVERAFAGLQPFSNRIHIRRYDEFIRREKRFVVIGRDPGYVLRMLMRDGADIRPTGAYRDQWVFTVQLTGGPPAWSSAR